MQSSLGGHQNCLDIYIIIFLEQERNVLDFLGLLGLYSSTHGIDNVE